MTTVKQRELDDARPYANGDPECPECRGCGYIGYDVPVGHPKFGAIDTCPCFKTKRAKAQQEKFIATSNLAGLEAKTFAAFNGTLQGVAGALAACRIYAAAPARWLLLTGGYGCGKSHLVTAIAHQALGQGIQTLYQTAPDFLRSLRATFDRDNRVTFDQVFSAAQNVELLILDDLGAEKASDFAAEQLFGLLDHRYARRLPTVITSNLSIPQIAAVNGRLGSRLSDTDLCVHVAMQGAHVVWHTILHTSCEQHCTLLGGNPAQVSSIAAHS